MAASSLSMPGDLENPGAEKSASSTKALIRKSVAEFLGTFLLVFGGCGSAVLATGVPNGLSYLGVALAFGLTVVAGGYAFGWISGGHFNPAVTLGMLVAGRIRPADAAVYVLSQFVSGIVAAGVLRGIAGGRPGFSADNAFATNGYDQRSPMHYSTNTCFWTEFLLTLVFLLVILCTTHRNPGQGVGNLAVLVIGLTLTLIHLISIPVTNTSVNPARSFGPAVFAGKEPMKQIWLFLLAPLCGSAVAGGLYRFLMSND